MQLVQSSVGMEFVNALLEPLCGTMRRRLKPLPREPKRYRPTISQNIQYLEDDDVLSEAEAAKQQQIKQRRKLTATASAKAQSKPRTKSNVSTKSEQEDDENAPLKATKPALRTPIVDDDEDDDDDDEEDDDKQEEINDPITETKQEEKHDEKEEKQSSLPSVTDSITPSRPFIFLAPKSESKLYEQWNDVLKYVMLNLGRLEAEEPKVNIKTENEIGNKIIDSINARFSYKHILQNLSQPLLDAIGDLKSAANVSIQDVESSAKCLTFLRDAHKTTLTVFRTTSDPLVTIWSAAILIVTTFFTATKFLVVTDEEVEDQEEEVPNKKMKDKKLRRERSQILRVLPQMDQILYELDDKDTLFTQLNKICKSGVYLTNNQWLLLDSVLEFSTQLSSVQFCILEERINSIIASVLNQFNAGSVTASVRYTFPIIYEGSLFTQYKKMEIMKDYYKQRAKVFMGKENGYYIRGKYKEMTISKTHKATFDDNTFKWNAMSNSEKHLFFRVLANKSKLKSITISSTSFGDDGCSYVSTLLNGSMILLLQPEDALLYYRLSKLLSSLHEEYLWDYIDYHDKLAALIDTTLITEDTVETLNNDLEKLLRHFQDITDWKSIKNSIPIDAGIFLRYQKSLYSLQRLYLSQCNIGSIGASYLADALCSNDSLIELVLDNNNIGDNGAKAIGKMLSRNVVLKEIDLADNKIDTNGFCAIVIGWQINKKYSALTNLDLSNNKTKLNTLIKDRSVPVDVAVSIQEIKESVKVASF